MTGVAWERWGAASGLGALATGAAAVVFERSGVSPNDPPARMAAFFAENRSALLMQANFPLAVMLVAVAVLSVRMGAFPRWLAVLSVVAAIALALPVVGLAQTSGLLAVGSPVAAYLPYPLYVAWLAGATALLVGPVGRVPPDQSPRTPETASAVTAPAGGGR